MSHAHTWEELGYIAPYLLIKYVVIKPDTTPLLSSIDKSIDPVFDSDCSLGVCSVCGMKLQHNYIVMDSKGSLFSVGSECVKKRNDENLIVAAKNLKSTSTKSKQRADRHEAALNQQALKKERALLRLQAIDDAMAPVVAALKRQNSNRAHEIVARIKRGDLLFADTDVSFIDDTCKKFYVDDARFLISQFIPT
jgi:hypothetical protein